ncbi:MAG: hypothetical protein ISP77_04065 [Methylophilaceae bacterium]|nr:hypothetical protein [Methylophilaceae bacterium]MBL6729036.1 hypothetical protein [Methylophilaceae bacterium]
MITGISIVHYLFDYKLEFKEKVSLLAKHGLFPKPLELHNGAVLWSEKEVKDWVGMKQQTEDWISRDIDSRLF